MQRSQSPTSGCSVTDTATGFLETCSPRESILGISTHQYGKMLKLILFSDDKNGIFAYSYDAILRKYIYIYLTTKSNDIRLIKTHCY